MGNFTKAIDALEKRKQILTPEQERILEYFWNKKRQRIRREVPKEVIYFLEAEEAHELERSGIRTGLDVKFTELRNKGYLESVLSTDSTIKLTRQGDEYLLKAHPQLLMYWERMLQLTPPTASLIATLVGFIASIFGVIQFVRVLSE